MELDFVTPPDLQNDIVEPNTDDVIFEGERCGICMDIIIDRGVLDCCQHWFCFGCIDNWSTITNLCPLCQNEFQSITCVPVYDTIGSNKVDDESIPRDDDWSMEGQSSTVSFPSYYIDENAVICLDGDGCKIRSEMANVEEDSNLDTSIACDSCDVWYHAFCVGFDTENTSEETWLCPRCTVDEIPQKSDATSVQRQNNQHDPQTSHPNCSSNVAFSGKVSVSVADAGETAIVVSMVGENDWTGKPCDNIQPSFDGDENMKVNVDNSFGSKIKVETLRSDKDGIQAILEAQGLELSLSRDTSCIQSQTSIPLLTDALKVSCYDEATNETSSSNGVINSLRKFKGYFNGNQQVECESTTGLHLGLSVGCFQSGDLAVDHMKDIIVKVEDLPDRDMQQQNLSDESWLRDEKIQPDNSKEAVRNVGLKRRQIDCSDGGDVSDKSEDANTVKRRRSEESLQTNQPEDQSKGNALPSESQNCTGQMTPSKDRSNAPVTDVSQKCPSEIAVVKDVKLEQPSEEEVVDSDIMSIVHGKVRRTSMGLSLQNPANESSKERETVAGLRVKKIMKRASGDKESSVVVQKLRKEIREAVRNKTSADIGENLFDPKLLAAFRAAIAEATVEPSSTKLMPSAVKAKKSLLQKGKVRENLTKKIYGDSNGRRKRAWDRECEIEFWKYRCSRPTKPEKIATLKSVLNVLRMNPSAECPGLDSASECQSANPILSRLYLADTSVFPRKDDIKPLSALASRSDSEQKRPKLVSGEKGQKTSFENCPPNEASKVSSKSGVPSVPSKGLQTKLPTLKDKTASSKVLPGKPSEVSEQNRPSIQSDDKKVDKRKWALEVLARKKAAGGQTAANEKQENNVVLKGNFPLLAQLPKDMWPALAASCHNKVPVPVRQAQLHRLTEHFLKKLDLPEICRNADTELTVADAINIEKEIADKSNSKIVYLNLCSQEVLRRADSSKTDKSMESNSSPLPASIDDKPEQSSSDPPTDPSVLEALRNAGLLSDSPPSSPIHKPEGPFEVNDSLQQMNEEGPDNIFEMDSHTEADIYGDFEYDLEDEDFIGATAIQLTKLPPEEGESKVKLVFSTLKPENTVDILEAEDGGKLGSTKSPESSPSLTSHLDNNTKDSFTEQGTEKSCDKPDPLTGEEGEELSLAECEELYGPDKEPLVIKFPEESSKLYGSVDTGTSTENTVPGENENVVPRQASHDEQSSEKSQTTGNISRKEKSDADNKKHSDSGTADSVAKKVEAYIKEHIRPLCKSGIITPEQYRWAVTKTTEKVMKYHSKDKNANFLIKEGEKVKRLAQQYVEASQQKERSDPS